MPTSRVAATAGTVGSRPVRGQGSRDPDVWDPARYQWRAVDSIGPARVRRHTRCRGNASRVAVLARPTATVAGNLHSMAAIPGPAPTARVGAGPDHTLPAMVAREHMLRTAVRGHTLPRVVARCRAMGLPHSPAPTAPMEVARVRTARRGAGPDGPPPTVVDVAPVMVAARSDSSEGKDARRGGRYAPVRASPVRASPGPHPPGTDSANELRLRGEMMLDETEIASGCPFESGRAWTSHRDRSETAGSEVRRPSQSPGDGQPRVAVLPAWRHDLARLRAGGG